MSAAPIDLALAVRVVALETAQTEGALPYAPTTAGDWPNPDPTTVKGALDSAASRLKSLEDGAIDDAGDLDYTPTTAGDWPNPDPTTVEGALDSAASRLKSLEDGAIDDAGDLDYTPTTAGDWPNPDPTTVEGALDSAASRLKSLEDGAIDDAGDLAYTPTTAGNWPDPDPTTVEGGLDAAASRLKSLEDGRPFTTTVSTGAVASGGTADLDIALPAGFSKCLVGPIVVTRTAGAGTSFKLQAHTQDNRSDDARHLFGSGSTAQTIGASAVAGPIRPLDGGHVVYAAMAYANTDASAAVRLRFTNSDGAESITCSVAVTVQPLP